MSAIGSDTARLDNVLAGNGANYIPEGMEMYPMGD